MDFWTLVGMLAFYNAYKNQIAQMPPGSPPLPLPDVRYHNGHNPDGTPIVYVVHWSIEKPAPGS